MKKIVLCYDFGGGGEQIKGLDSLYAITPFNRKEMVKKGMIQTIRKKK